MDPATLSTMQAEMIAVQVLSQSATGDIQYLQHQSPARFIPIVTSADPSTLNSLQATLSQMPLATLQVRVWLTTGESLTHPCVQQRNDKHILNTVDHTIVNNYSAKWRWVAVDIYWAAKQRGKYPKLATDTEIEYFFMKCVKGHAFLEVICKKHNLKVYANYVQCDLFWWSNFIMIRFGSPERDYSLSKGDMTLEKGLRSQHSKDVQLPTSSKRNS